MSAHVGDSDQHVKGERHRFHPEYEGFTEWLDAEAPPRIESAPKHRNAARYPRRRVVKRSP